jgi:hypothetical protein
MNKQILENRLIDSVALVINFEKNYSGSQLVSQIVCLNTPEIKSKIKNINLYWAFMNWRSNQKIICLKLDIKNE